MAQNEVLKRYIEAGIAFTEVTRARAEEFVKELARGGEVQWDQVQSQVDELVDWSKRNSDQVVNVVRSEVANQIAQLGIATKDHLEALERRLEETFTIRLTAMAPRRRSPKPAPAEVASAGGVDVVAAPPTVPAKKAPSKRAPAKRAATASPAPTPAPVKKAPAKRAKKAATTAPAPAKKVAAKKVATKQVAAEKVVAKKVPAGSKPARATTRSASRTRKG